MEDVQPPAKLSRLDVGMLITLVSVAIGGVVGLIAVLDADSELGALGIGVGVTFLIAPGRGDHRLRAGVPRAAGGSSSSLSEGSPPPVSRSSCSRSPSGSRSTARRT